MPVPERARLNIESSEDITDLTGDEAPLGRHLSKSASELSSPRELLPEARPCSAAPATHHQIHASVVAKTHNFFTTLKVSYINANDRTRTLIIVIFVSEPMDPK